MVHWVGLILPFAYIGILAGSLAMFSSLNRKRKAGRSYSHSLGGVQGCEQKITETP